MKISRRKFGQVVAGTTAAALVPAWRLAPTAEISVGPIPAKLAEGGHLVPHDLAASLKRYYEIGASISKTVMVTFNGPRIEDMDPEEISRIIQDAIGGRF